MNWTESLRSLIANLVPKGTSRATPSTLVAELKNIELTRPLVFDPALRQFQQAHRASEPRFDSREDTARWEALRKAVLHHILCRIGESPCAPHLVLRGSSVMFTWFGQRARNPRDLDWVVIPREWQPNWQQSRTLIKDLFELLQGSVIADGLSIAAGGFALEEIWTYEKAPGERIIVPWEYKDPRFNGTIQMDVVFGEWMAYTPEVTDVLIDDFPAICLQTVSRQQSLAWKLLWLISDSYPMGKDLYDAVILAEETPVNFREVQLTFELAGESFGDFSRRAIEELNVDWDVFLVDYPAIAGTQDTWKQRLLSALEPLFQEMNAKSQT